MVQLPSLLVLSLALQVKVGADSQPPNATVRQDVSVSVSRREDDDEPRRRAVTAEHLRTAFGTPAARSLLERARAARLEQDSALISYDATTYLRVSVGLGFSKIGRDRVLFRHENATRVRWHRDVGAWIDVTGSRTALPMAQDEVDDIDTEFTPVPYFPGQEPLLIFDTEAIEEQVDDRELIHPLAEGAEAYYTYAVGDSVQFRLPDGRTIHLRELDVRPRESRWNAAIGSLWFDVQSGQLVRAAYRLAVPMDIWAIADSAAAEDPDDEGVPPAVKAFLSPMRAELRAVAVEYGLHQGRFWLPRLRSMEAFGQASFMRVPVRFEQRFQYSAVNAVDSLPEIILPPSTEPPDSLSGEELRQWQDSMQVVRRERRRAVQDSIEMGLREPGLPCDSAGMRTKTRRGEAGLRVAVRIPCDVEVLRNSPDLPASIYDEGEQLFGAADRDALIAEALAMGAQPPFAIGRIPPTLHWGLEFTRFNRIEGLSTGALVDQKLGAGYTATLLGRIGHADLEPNFELSLARTNLTTTVRGGVYNRLVSAGDWGNPLSFGSSLSAVLFGRDEGFYYRASGAEIEWTHVRGAQTSLRLFAERQRTAAVDNEFSLGAAFIPNLAARTGQYVGMATRIRHTRGLDPNGFRIFSDGRVETAVSDSAGSMYGRAALDLTMTVGLGRLAAALTGAAGSSVGIVPPQRRWYLGGAYTVRGQQPDTAQSGDAFWLGRLEVGGPLRAVRPVVFGDVGWVGDRARWRDAGRPMSGVGVGASILDGLVRLDLSRGIFPRERMRLDLYVEGRF